MGEGESDSWLRIKLITLGDSGVGKTSLLTRWARGEFEALRQTTVGSGFMAKEHTIDGSRVKIVLCDTAGQEAYRSLVTLYARDANGAVIVFDLTARDSWDSIDMWYGLIEELQGLSLCPVVFCGTKADLADRRKVMPAEIEEKMAKGGFDYYECSSLTGEGVEHMFESLARMAWLTARTLPKLEPSDRKGCKC